MTITVPTQQDMTAALLQIEQELTNLAASQAPALHGLLLEMTGVLESLRTRLHEAGDGVQVERERTATLVLTEAEEGIRQAREMIVQGEDGRSLVRQTLPVLHAARVAVASLEVRFARRDRPDAIRCA